MIARSWLIGLGLLGAVLVVTPAGAQESSDSTDSAEGEGKTGSADRDEAAEAGDRAESDKAEGDEKKEEADAVAPETGNADSPIEQKGKTYRFVGARYRLIVVPKFIINLFSDGGTTVAVHSFGPEFAIRKDGFEYDFSLWYAAYSMDPTIFKSKSDGEEAWELVESKIKVLYATVDFLWSHEFNPKWALNYGMGAGLGLVFGPLYRNQAFRNNTGVGPTYLPCAGPNQPPISAPNGLPYCDGTIEDHYNNYEEPSWGDGGSKPVIFPWLAVQTGVRFKPVRQFAARLDAGFGLSGFFFGLGADYGL